MEEWVKSLFIFPSFSLHVDCFEICLYFSVGNKHVSEIASMALDLLCASIVFKIPRMPNSRLQLRMGIHSGPAIGVVSGSKTPKYWYFYITMRVCSCFKGNKLYLTLVIPFIAQLGGLHTLQDWLVKWVTEWGFTSVKQLRMYLINWVAFDAITVEYLT